MTNSGNTPATFSYEVSLTPNRDQLAPKNRIHRQELSLQPSRGSEVPNVRYAVSLSHARGPHFVVMALDPENRVREKDESSNRVARPITILDPQAATAMGRSPAESVSEATDLAVADVRVSDYQVSIGDDLDVAFELRNVGSTRIVSRPYVIRLPRSGRGGHSVFEGASRSLDPGQVESVSRRVTIPPDALIGERRLFVELDEGQEAPANRDNNRGAAPLRSARRVSRI